MNENSRVNGYEMLSDVGITSTKSKSACASVAFIYLYSVVHNLGWIGAMMLYLVEILPYTMRAKGIALF
jgi:hypothetical protein